MIFFFYGANTFASRSKLREMTETFLKKTGSDLGLERIAGDKTDYNQLAGALSAAPFMSSSRLVIIEDLGQNKVVRDRIGQLLELIPETTVAVFYEREADKRTSFFKALEAKAKAVKFDDLSGSQLENWIIQETKSQGGSIDRRAAAKLAEIAGGDQWRLSQELSKLVNFNEQITLESIGQLVEVTPAQTIFDLVEAMSSGQTERALTIYRDLLAQQISEHYVLTMIIWQLRNLLLAKTAGAMPSQQLAKKAGINPYVAGKAQAAQRRFSLGFLKAAFLAAIDTDYAIKTGAGEPQQLVEGLVVKISIKD